MAGLETLIALHHLAGDRVAVTLVAPERDFLHKTLVVNEPFDPTPAERRELAPIAAEFGARFIQRALAQVVSDRRTIVLSDGEELGYESLAVCAGARSCPPFRRAITFDVTGARRSTSTR